MTQPRPPESGVLRQAGLPEPLGRVLRSPSPDARQAVIWSAICSRLEGAERAKVGFAKGRMVTLLYATMLVACGLFIGFGGSELERWVGAQRPSASPAFTSPHEPGAPVKGRAPTDDAPLQGAPLPPPFPTVAGVSSQKTAGVLTLHGGDVFSGLADSARQQNVRFSDDSTLTAAPHTDIEVLAMTERDVVLRLVNGAIDAHVIPGGPRRWVVEAGALSVEVVGTRFSVERGPNDVLVQVNDGAVLVRSPQLPDGIQRLQAGQRVALPVLRTEPPDLVAMALTRADKARLRGDWAKARESLEQIVHQHAGDPRVGLAAYQLALVTEQQGAPGSQVIEAFQRALSKAVGSSLRQDCYWRLYQAQVRAGQDAAAARTAGLAWSEFPKGRYSERFDAVRPSSERRAPSAPPLP